jgi:hypothetical protein
LKQLLVQAHEVLLRTILVGVQALAF